MSEMRVLGAAVVGPAEGEAAKARATAFKRETRQRYLDSSVEAGLEALHAAMHGDADPGLAQAAAAGRIGLLLATALGPQASRGDYLRSYGQRGEKSASATLFTNCGYNIAGAMLARSQNIRGPVLTFGADDGWDRKLLDVARRLLVAARAEIVYAGRIEPGAAAIVGLALGRGDITVSWRLSSGENRAAGHEYRIETGDEPDGEARRPAGAEDMVRRIAALRCRPRVAAPILST
ncbi:MAG: hypothetical protein QOI11_3746 [Candidatus Eremiobacteraeota bacterium]|jgi:hypothetical protein|nr:hypothetical protein [Candidatus Eremiobacteraeota bacterium]